MRAAVSSCPEGTILAGIQYLKDAPPLVAKADEAYPAWLWTLLDDTPPAGKKGAKQARNATAREEQERLARERERERRIATETQEEKWERERAELDEERRKMRRENREKIRYQNFMKTT
ncbi:hypothetical protein CALCODRAFT_439685 [Calocera cornea HHB12733]|uniref:Large ribosomal subunit protein mL54 n=1 Tax=Calocera cornea HHB12733 TaxID=1353952 RepID=A0A165DX58_9BASI|nr:hypothetical protein CALCODRAFT_439685 [Calocera cornea HHB12733]